MRPTELVKRIPCCGLTHESGSGAAARILLGQRQVMRSTYLAERIWFGFVVFESCSPLKGGARLFSGTSRP